ncbi:MAG: nickel pincer cofactor biosynthesis protein LarB [Chloroflexi bacterium]|nr:nickel pincer cofactor biosynthesis protein LarB [Chloroflexota bacterium]
MPLEALRRALVTPGGPSPDSESVGDFARLDTGRERRKGVPEVVYAASKTPDQVVAICQRVVAASGRAILSRVPPATASAVQAAFGAEWEIDQRAGGSLLIVRRPDAMASPTGGRVAIIAAGTSDLPFAEEAAAVAAEMGCAVRQVTDVGVAGLHRLFGPLQQVFDDGVDVLIVAAGMDGALPSVVAGLASVPVIGLPTPVGYGLGGEGVGALMTMLQSCAPGLAVVNIGNGVGAGAMAALIANQVAAARASIVAPATTGEAS